LRDPNLLPALSGRALALFHLKEWKKAIADYDKILSLDPQDAGSYNDRGLAKSQLDDTRGAISDFDKAIQLKKRELMKSNTYEARADAHMKDREWDLAVRDLTTAISLWVGGQTFSLMNIRQFRSIYPEYKLASDEAVARKLHQTFYPNLKYEDYSKSFLYEHGTPSFVLRDLYLKRLDVHAKAGNWREAAIEFRRVANGFPEYSDDRWREMSQVRNSYGHVYIDLKTFEVAPGGSVKFWIKQARDSSDVAGPYSLGQWEFDCGARRVRMVSVVNYDASGKPLGNSQGSKWESVVPGTFGETLHNVACRG
jgi:tetratricopeptide (TPR) repeat protein